MSITLEMDKIPCPHCNEETWVFFTCMEDAKEYSCMHCKEKIDLVGNDNEGTSSESAEL